MFILSPFPLRSDRVFIGMVLKVHSKFTLLHEIFPE
jgi:hypothetical protein